MFGRRGEDEHPDRGGDERRAHQPVDRDPAAREPRPHDVADEPAEGQAADQEAEQVGALPVALGDHGRELVERGHDRREQREAGEDERQQPAPKDAAHAVPQRSRLGAPHARGRPHRPQRPRHQHVGRGVDREARPHAGSGDQPARD
jgi:hypothetical protein